MATPAALVKHDAAAAESLFGIYVHWPFCLAKCPYCDFNSHVRERTDGGRWRQALLRELDHYAGKTGGRRVSSVFFGGGTPSLMAPETTAAVIEKIGQRWKLDPDAEITLEANPTSVEAARFAGYRAAGVNRLSLGVQALDDEALGFLGRQHSAAEALEALALARRHFPRISFDLIYARPGQSLASWRAELRRALEQETEHLSLYQLTIEQGTAFHGAWRRGELRMPEAAESADHYELTQEVTAAAGLPAYEVSNHAGPDAESRHNLTYWRYDDYLGIGPGAHGRLTLAGQKVATRQHRAPEAWLAAVEGNGHATRRHDPLDRSERLIELTMMGLRLTEGIPRQRLRRVLDLELEAAFDSARLAALIEAGDLLLDGRGLRPSARGRQRLNAVLEYLLADSPVS